MSGFGSNNVSHSPFFFFFNKLTCLFAALPPYLSGRFIKTTLSISLSPLFIYFFFFLIFLGVSSMKFAVKAWSSGKARTGILQLGNCPGPIETPALLLSTRKGLPHFISPDLLPSLPSPDSHLLQVSPLHL